MQENTVVGDIASRDPLEKRRRDFHLILDSLLRLRKIESPSNAARYFSAMQNIDRLSLIAGEDVAETELKALAVPVLIELSAPIESPRKRN